MYNISEETIRMAIKIAIAMVLCNSFIRELGYLKISTPYIKYIVTQKMTVIKSFFRSAEEIKKEEEKKQKKEEEKKTAEEAAKLEADRLEANKFENKYLEKFKKFPNEFCFNEEDKQNEIDEKKELIETNAELQSGILCFQKLQAKVENIIGMLSSIEHENKYIVDEKLIKILFDYYAEIGEELDDDHMFSKKRDLPKLIQNAESLERNIENVKSKILDEEGINKKAHENAIDKKLDKFINNYVLETTPLGNIYMRYNNSKKSFEYFSNNSIPYRYLEPVGRKYVMTYWCKPIFVDIDEELKRAEFKQAEIQKTVAESIAKAKKAQIADKSNAILAARPMKNRNTNDSGSVPSQVKVVSQTKHDKHLVKENANRYTWEGRLNGFCPLKKIDKKVTDKQLTLSYADFKKMQQKK
jgi:hypothetical protein